MDKKLWSRVGLTAAAFLGAAAVSGVAGPMAQAAESSGNVSDTAVTAAERIASSDAAVNMRYQQAPAGTDYFGSDDLVEEHASSDGFTWG